MVTCYLGIGSNLGERRKNIRLAVKKINSLSGTEIIKLSKIIETEPQGGPRGQEKYLNAALKIKTSLPAVSLLKKLKNIEKDLGRVKTVRYGPRVIDLDILFYGDKIINRNDLKVPHPKIFERDFVLGPLSEVI
ncbi:MAG: 2-amino-4-hydroxy-6-hydroxymethyldihydropteridine diphosphokinase [Candidatus Omnitrophota bacterium]|jgi:2-amino-4-hydroxy-6-hydroxymethyldihydropteridine diphosphokinase